MYQYDYARPALVVDLVVRRIGTGEVLLIERGDEPFKGMAALPGGFVNEGETVQQAAVRELREETGVVVAEHLALVGVFSRPGRDPRGWVVSAGYRAWVPQHVTTRAGDDAASARFYPVLHLPPLAFDHDDILAAAL